jgi:hypothetical protein
MKHAFKPGFFALATLLCIFCAGTKGCGDEDPHIHYINPAILPYTWFPVETYWVYEREDFPALTDSVYVLRRKHEIEDHDDGFGQEYYLIQVNERGRLVTRCSYANGYDYNEPNSVRHIQSYSIGNQHIRQEIFFWDPHESDTSYHAYIPYPPAYTFVTNRYSNFEVMGITYPEAFEIACPPTDEAVSTISNVWVMGIGIVRYTRSDSSVWNLRSFRLGR